MNPKFKVALLEDRGAIQAAISETVHALAQDHMDHKRAGKILYGLHLAIICAKVPEEIVATAPVRDLFQNEEGEEIGPEQIGYDQEDEPLERIEDELPESIDDENENEDETDPEENNDRESGDGGAKNSKADHHNNNRPAKKANPPNRTKALKAATPLHQTIASYIADLKQHHPELAAQALIKKMERGLTSIP